ncbi:hypothetical protein [Streptomyces sp. NBC_01363]|uniref:hypothetical protein n=1 Tax=Streptomyces sp. NBC_01363 TaxID=2903840 RepID=UPI0022521A1C|nr:hypothetical protein [Streptomyces sp. NBC_01363]MCX4733332.1 hypothetical protein [Streptomyces sp. NBC_01363]
MDKGVIPSCPPIPSGPAFHLVHRSPSWDHYAVDAPSRGEEHFAVSAELRPGQGPDGDRHGHFHDWQFLTGLVLDAGGFVARTYFGVPPYLPTQFRLFELDLHDPAAWRAGNGRTLAVGDLRVRPSRALDGAPHRVEIEGAVSLDSTPCARIRSTLGFLVPMPMGVPEPAGPGVPVRPCEVGRVSPGSVLLGTPVLSSYGRLTSPVLIPLDTPGSGTEPGRAVPDLTIVEVIRQASLLCAGLTCGLRPERSVTAALTVRRRGAAVVGAPLHCTAVPGTLTVDEHGYPRVPLVLTIHQNGRVVVEATAEVHQDF